MKIRVAVDRFTDLRSRLRQAYERKDEDTVRDLGLEFESHMIDRFAAGTLSETERTWLDAHPDYEAYLERVLGGVYDHDAADWDYYDLFHI